MWKIYTLIIIAAINLILALSNFLIASKKNNILNFIVGLFNISVCLFASFITVDVYSSNRMTEEKEKEEIESYYEIKNTIEEIKTLDCIQNKTELLFHIYLEVKEVNSIIMKNKEHYDSKWDGFEYSEKIGNLKILEL